MSRFRKGDAVNHPAYGKGTVNGIRIDGYEVRVSFGAYSLWLPARELAPAEGGLRLVGAPIEEPLRSTERTSFDAIMRMLKGEPIPGTGTTGKTTIPVERPAGERARPRSGQSEPRFRPAQAKRPVRDAAAIEAFRLGIVPIKHIAQWTVGREREVAQVRAFLQDHAEGAILIEGAYGAGKSHLLQFLAIDAEAMGFAVATAGFDPSEATAAFPKKAYRRLVRNFVAHIDGQPLDFRGFLREIAARPNWRDTLGDHWLLGRFLDRLARGKADEDDWEAIEGQSRSDRGQPTLHDYSTCANLYVNLLTALSRGASEVLGMAGLAVLLDEAEVARNVMYRYQALRGVNFFRGLVLAANDEPALVEEDLLREATLVGATTRLVYSGHNPTRFTSGIPSQLKIAFALTPGSLQEEFRKTRETIVQVELDVLSVDQLRTLYLRICDTFESVYGVRMAPRDRDRVFRLLATADRISSTRGFIKAAIEALDYVRFYPAGNVDDILLEGVG
jgi:hypothetical protein